MKNYVTIAGDCHYEHEILRSKFITNMAPIDSLSQGLEIVRNIKKRYCDATHNCYAIVGLPQSNEIKCADDGEPTGTAGAPMLNAITKNDLYGVACVVTRYFGGIKLGAGGLVAAYSLAVSECIKQAELCEYKYSSVISFVLPYSVYKLFNMAIADTQKVVLDTQFTDNVRITIAVEDGLAEAAIAAYTAVTEGSHDYKLVEKKYIKF